MTITREKIIERLDSIETSLPSIPSKALSLGRASARRVESTVSAVSGAVSERIESVGSTARSGADTVFGQAKSAVEHTTDVARTAAQSTATEARSQVDRTVEAATDATEDLLDDATEAVDPDSLPQGVAYETWTKAELYQRAQELDIDGRSAMSKRQLVAALRS